MLKLNKRMLKRLQKIWADNPEGLELGQFVKMMVDEIYAANLDEKL
jgi:hypothetical protein